MTDTIALILGGSLNVFEEYVAALKLCASAGTPFKVFACNDMIEAFPDRLDNGVTLHPEKLVGWLSRREAAGKARPAVTWGHRHFANVDQWTRDWSGSVGLFAIKIAREEGFKKIICCGIPMNPDAKHFKRKVTWNAANAFRRAWVAHAKELRPYVRSMSGWTKELLGPPTMDWLLSDFPDSYPLVRSGRNYSMRA